ncbi:hypothetical protein PARMER_01402 [Parabacteroides merdae ATCC 43184]|nr:hypothetical protein PARMER_01402 [Parabacteroides merdae ATCC 43184]
MFKDVFFFCDKYTELFFKSEQFVLNIRYFYFFFD